MKSLPPRGWPLSLPLPFANVRHWSPRERVWIAALSLQVAKIEVHFQCVCNRITLGKCKWLFLLKTAIISPIELSEEREDAVRARKRNEKKVTSSLSLVQSLSHVLCPETGKKMTRCKRCDEWVNFSLGFRKSNFGKCHEEERQC